MGIYAYGVADAKPIMSLLATCVAVVSAVLARRGSGIGAAGGVVGGRALPRAMVNLAVVVAALGVLAWALVVRGPLVSDLSDFLVLILMIKMLDRRRARDEAQMLGLSMFVVIGSVLTSNSLALGLVLIAYMPMVIVAVVWFQVYAGRLSAMAGAAASARAGMSDGWGREGRRALGAVTLAGLVLLLVLSTLAFVITPRTLAAQAFGAWGSAQGSAQADFRAEMNLGQTGTISASDDAVMDVTLSKPDGEPLIDPPEVLYLRGAVLDTYNPRTGRWRYRNDNRVATQPLSDGGRPATPEALTSGQTLQLSVPPTGTKAGWVRQTISIRNAAAGVGPMFTLWRPLTLLLPEGGRVAYTGELVVRRLTGPPGRFTYVTVGAPDVGQELPTAHRPRERIAGPEVTERITELAREILTAREIEVKAEWTDASSARKAATALRNALRERCAYTLEMEAPPQGVDPIEDFLFTRRRGHCEYFAAGLTALLRSVGIDARVVTGYAAGEYNPVSGSWVVRKADAHAWVEAMVGTSPVRWEVFDPTPPSSLGHAQRAAGESVFAQFVTRLRQTYDAAEIAWVDSIIGFDKGVVGTYDLFSAGENARRQLRAVSSRVAALTAWLRGDELTDGRRGLNNGPIVTLVVLVAGCLAVGWGVAVVARRVKRGVAGARVRRRAAGRGELRFYGQMLGELARAGFAKPEGVPPAAHVAALGAAGVRGMDQAALLVEIFYRTRFGGSRLGTEEALAARRALAGLRGALARGLGGENAGAR